PELLEIELDGDVTPQRHQLARQSGVVGLREQRFPRALAWNLGRFREDRVEIAVGLEQLHRRLVPDALDAGDVVGAVADQREIIDDALRGHAEPLARVGLIHPLLFDRGLAAAPRIEQRDTLADQLVEILVPGDDDGLEAAARRALRERRNDIIGLVAVEGDHRNVKRIEDLADALERAIEVLLQLLAELLARGLVLGVLLLPE